MNRRSFIFVSSAILILSVCSANGQTSSLYLSKVSGTFGTDGPDADSFPDTLKAGQPIVFTIALKNQSGEAVVGSVNGFRIYHNGTGLEWPLPVLDTLDIALTSSTGWKARYDLIVDIFHDPDNNGGAGSRNADTVGIGGAKNIGIGFPNGYDFDIVTITIPSPGIDSSQTGRTLCLDSAGYGVNPEWLWALNNSSVVFPAWSGPHCFTLYQDISTAINESNTDNMPAKFDLSQNYPNPFNPATNIKFDLAARSHVSLIVYNLLGQKVSTLVNEVLPAGTYRTEWLGRTDNGASVSSGIYFYKMVVGNFAETRKMILIK